MRLITPPNASDTAPRNPVEIFETKSCTFEISVARGISVERLLTMDFAPEILFVLNVEKISDAGKYFASNTTRPESSSTSTGINTYSTPARIPIVTRYTRNTERVLGNLYLFSFVTIDSTNDARTIEVSTMSTTLLKRTKLLPSTISTVRTIVPLEILTVIF